MSPKQYGKLEFGIAALGVALLNGPSEAAIVVFDNSTSEFVLPAGRGLSGPGLFLDPTVSPESQSQQGQVARGLYYIGVSGGGSESPNSDELASGGVNIRLARCVEPTIITNAFGVETRFFLATVFELDQHVSAGENFQSGVSVALFYPGGGAFHAPFLGQHVYVGFSVMIEDNAHFGWIELDFSTGPFVDGGTIPMYQPIRWAYETQPNTPITVPGAPAGAIILVGAATFSIRRRRS